LKPLFDHANVFMCTLCENNILDSSICLHVVSQLMLCTRAARHTVPAFFRWCRLIAALQAAANFQLL